MLGRTQRLIASIALATLALSTSTSALACAFHATNLGDLGGAHPGSLSVAVAIAEAKDDELLPALDPTRSATGYMVAAFRLESFAAAIASDSAAALSKGFSLVLVGPRLWTTVRFDKGAVTTELHAPGPAPGLPVVMTDFLVVDAILRGGLGIERALKRGLIRIDGDPDQAVEHLLLASLGPLSEGR